MKTITSMASLIFRATGDKSILIAPRIEGHVNFIFKNSYTEDGGGLTYGCYCLN